MSVSSVRLSLDVAIILQDLQHMTDKAPKYCGKVFINQEKFFILATQLRKAVCIAGQTYFCEKCGHQGHTPPLNRRESSFFKDLEALEQLVESGQFPICGGVWVGKQNYNALLEKLTLTIS